MIQPDLYPTLYEAVDDEDILLRQSLAYLQEIVGRHLLETGLAIDTMSYEQQQALVDKINPYLEFELRHAEGIWEGMPFAVSGTGGVLVIDRNNDLKGMQRLHDGDFVVGLVDDVQALSVPALECLRMADETSGDEISVTAQSFSAIVTFADCKLFSPDSHGRLSSYDFRDNRVSVPLIYGMQMTAAPMVSV